MNKSQAHKIIELYNAGGAVPASEWTVGSGRYTTRAAIPAGAKEYIRGMTGNPEHVEAVLEGRPRIKSVIGLADPDAALKAAVDYLKAKKYPIPQIAGA